MKYKLLIIFFMLGCSTDLAPDDIILFNVSCDELDVVMRNVIVDMFFVLKEILRFCWSNYLLPAWDFTSFIVQNVHIYFDRNLYIWLLFIRLDFVHHHTVHGVRCYNSFRKVFFVRSAGSAACVLTILLTACGFNTSSLVTCGRVLQSPSTWTVLCTPWQIFAVKSMPSTATTYTFGLLSSVDYYLELMYNVCTNHNILSIARLLVSTVLGKMVIERS